MFINKYIQGDFQFAKDKQNLSFLPAKFYQLSLLAPKMLLAFSCHDISILPNPRPTYSLRWDIRLRRIYLILAVPIFYSKLLGKSLRHGQTTWQYSVSGLWMLYARRTRRSFGIPERVLLNLATKDSLKVSFWSNCFNQTNYIWYLALKSGQYV